MGNLIFKAEGSFTRERIVIRYPHLIDVVNVEVANIYCQKPEVADLGEDSLSYAHYLVGEPT